MSVLGAGPAIRNSACHNDHTNSLKASQVLTRKRRVLDGAVELVARVSPAVEAPQQAVRVTAPERHIHDPALSQTT